MNSVGPGRYYPEKVDNLEHKPYYSFGIRTPLVKSSDTPGNGVD